MCLSASQTTSTCPLSDTPSPLLLPSALLIWIIFTMEDQLQEAQEKYYSTQNRVNMQLAHQHRLKKQSKSFREELDLIRRIAQNINRGRGDPSYLSRAVIAQDQYLRNLIQENDGKIRQLERRLEGSELSSHSERISEIHDSYSKVLSGQLQKKTRETMSLLRGRVEETKKKTKELLKEIQGLQEGQKTHIDEFSVSNQHLKEVQAKIKRLRDELLQKREEKKDE